MVFTVETNIKTDVSGFKSLLKKLEEATKTVVVSGVINGDADATEAAVLNEFGGEGIYPDGSKVRVPPRPFVRSAIEHHSNEILEEAESQIDFDKDIDLKGALNAMGKKTAELQEDALESNGEGIPGWQKHNSPKTIDIKGFDKPLFTRHGTTFPIDYELRRRSA